MTRTTGWQGLRLCRLESTRAKVKPHLLLLRLEAHEDFGLGTRRSAQPAPESAKSDVRFGSNEVDVLGSTQCVDDDQGVGICNLLRLSPKFCRQRRIGYVSFLRCKLPELKCLEVVFVPRLRKISVAWLRPDANKPIGPRVVPNPPLSSADDVTEPGAAKRGPFSKFGG